MHHCAHGPCEVAMVGPGLTCDGQWDTHVAKTLTDLSLWSHKANEGEPL